MFYWLTGFADQIQLFNVFRYITFRTGGATITTSPARTVFSRDAAGVDVVFACGPHMRALYDALPESRRGAYAKDSAGLEAALLKTVRAGDVVMVKGSLGSAMGPLAGALRAHLKRKGAQPQ